MNTIRFTYRPLHHSHTHCQAPQANTQAQACQRVCLSHNEKKKLKFSFHFKKNNSQPDSKIFGQLVAKLNKIKSCKTRTIRMPACNSVYVAIAGEEVNRRPVLLRKFVLIRQGNTSNPLLHIHANRYA